MKVCLLGPQSYYASLHRQLVLYRLKCILSANLWFTYVVLFNLAATLLGCHKVTAICAMCSQPCIVATTLHDGCEVVAKIVKLHSTSKS